MNHAPVFVDWITITQLHPEGGLPIITGGITVHYSAEGVPIVERNRAASIPGSFDTSVRVGCDGYRVALSGNPGRFSRQDNVFNYGFAGTISACNRILDLVGLPHFTTHTVKPEYGPQGQLYPGQRPGARISRLDVTRNYSAGSESNARAFIRWLTGRSIARMKRGFSGDESVWWSNTHHMLKAYIKHLEMQKHGTPEDSLLLQWLKKQGVVRVEIELKKRLLSKLGLNCLADVTDEKLSALFDEQTAIFRSADRSHEDDILEHVPQRSRVYAAAWLAGKDMREMASRATLFRHARILRECGLDILQPRNIQQFPTKVRVIELTPLDVPEWYQFEKAA